MKATTTNRTRKPRARIDVAATAAAILLALLAAAPAARADEGDGLGYDGSYSYLRTLDGSATLTQGDTGERDAMEINQPALAGDRLWVAPRSRAEVVLSDGNLLRLDGDSEVVFERLAASPDTADRVTVLRLREGNVQLVVVDGAAGDELPRVETANATVSLQSAGRYRITSDGEWTEVVVRDGYAEVVTDRGTVAARPDEEVVVEGTSWPRTSLRAASAFDGLERWGDRLEERLAAAEVPYVDESLRYEAAPLADYGSWVEVGGSWAWRPRVAVGWRPYWQGRWASTPAGLTWVSSEPWGWVPYHYGTWDYSPGFGWVWFPGSRFATAWVYWYWGPSYTAWVPVGYYTRHYSPYYRSGFRFGVYGWAGGDWGFFADWVFCPTGYFGSRNQPRYLYDGRDWHRRHGSDRVPRGIITTDTRGITPDRWHKPDEVLTVLRTRPSAVDRGERNRTGRGAELPDVTPFVARRDTLPPEVKSRVLVDDGAGRRLAGTPLAPAGHGSGPAAETTRPGVVRWRDDGSAGDSRRSGGVAAVPEPGRPAGVVRAVPRADAERPVSPGGPAARVVRPADSGRPAASGEGARPTRVGVRSSAPERNDGAPAAGRPVVVRPRADGEAPAPSATRGRPVASRPPSVRPAERSRSERPATVRPPAVRPDAGREIDSGALRRAPVRPEPVVGREPQARSGGAAPRAVPSRPQRPATVRPQPPRTARPQVPAAARPAPAAPGRAPAVRPAPTAPRSQGGGSRAAPAPPRASASGRGSAPSASAPSKSRSSGGEKAARARATRPRDRD